MPSIFDEIDSVFDTEIKNVRNRLLSSKSFDYLKFSIYEDTFNELREMVKDTIKKFN